MRNWQDRKTATQLAVAVVDIVATIQSTKRQGNRSMSDTYDIDRRPPCWEVGKPCPNHCAQAHARHIIDNHVELHGPWAGWRLAGRDLVAPTGERIPERRLRGLLWRADAIDLRDSARARNKARKARQQAMVKVVVVDLATWRDRHFGRMAG
ncbi:putative phage-related protein [Xanthomonas albilineans]|nr:putative phage-related protein [Xanthomonas albilineans]